MQTVRIGVVGIGNMGSEHAQYLFAGDIKGAVLSAVCDIKPERLEWAKEQFGDKISYFSTYEDMLKANCMDAVIIAVPHYTHPEYVIKGFEAGLNVICEKPAGVYTKQVLKMNAAAEKSGKVFSMMYNQRTNPLYQKVREMVQGGQLGELKRCIWIITNWYRTQAYYNSGGWRATWSGEGGGVMLNQCPHNLDLWQWIFGMPKRIRACCYEGKYHNIEVEDDVTAYAEYENGATGVFITTTGEYPGTNRLEITGDAGKLVVEGTKLTFWKLKTPERVHTFTCEESFQPPEYTVEEITIDEDPPQHRGITQNFVNAILNGETLLAPGVEGINGLNISNAIFLSSWLDNWVELPVDPELYYEKLQEKIKNSTFVKEEVKDAKVGLGNSFKN